MATVTAPAAPQPSRPQKRFTVAEYHKLIEIGVVTARDRCELIRGYIVQKPPMNPPHAATVGKLMERLFPLVGAAGTIRVQMPITLADSEPQPDVVVATGRQADYEAAHPHPGEILLVAEVADTTLADDRTTQLELYAESGLSEYWIVNVVDRQVEVYTQPDPARRASYRSLKVYGPSETVPVVLAGQAVGSIPVREILPR